MIMAQPLSHSTSLADEEEPAPGILAHKGGLGPGVPPGLRRIVGVARVLGSILETFFFTPKGVLPWPSVPPKSSSSPAP